MADPHVISALIRLRRELTCDLERMQADVAAIDRVLRLVKPDLDPTAIRALAFRKREGWADRGQISRIVSETLRDADRPLSVIEIADSVTAAMDDGSDARKNRKRVHKALDRMRLREVVRVADESGKYQLWEISR
jgi:DNA-binding transcriptional ArsR family regulator